MIRHGKTSYSPNSVIVGLPEGYYAGLEDGGFPSPRRPSFHKIMNFLPPESLIEVRRIEVSTNVGVVFIYIYMYVDMVIVAL